MNGAGLASVFVSSSFVERTRIPIFLQQQKSPVLTARLICNDNADIPAVALSHATAGEVFPLL